MNGGKEASAELNGCKPFGGAHVGLFLAMAHLSAYEREQSDKLHAEKLIRHFTPRPPPPAPKNRLGGNVKDGEPFQDANGKWYVRTKGTIRCLPNVVITESSPKKD